MYLILLIIFTAIAAYGVYSFAAEIIEEAEAKNDEEKED